MEQTPLVSISPDIRREIYDSIMAHEDYLGRYRSLYYEDQNIVDFLKLIWDLPSMPSEDSRFKNAEGDARQHLLNNDDWEDDYVFLERFNLLAGDNEHFVKFVEACVSPFVRLSGDEISTYVDQLNPILNKSCCELTIVDYIDNLPHYRIKPGTGFNFVKRENTSNLIPVYVDGKSDKVPFFSLMSRNWDDYTHKTSFDLYYTGEDFVRVLIGSVKICKKDEAVTKSTLPKSFYSLDSTYCSLGQHQYYYFNIKRLLDDKATSFLYSMKDAACYSQIADEFANEHAFRYSLLRDNDAGVAFNLGRYIIAGFDPDDPVSFSYTTRLPYCPDYDFCVKFDFGKINQKNNFNRVIAIVGENGVGKSSLLKNIAYSLATQQKECFSPHNPLFTKVIAASYSVFDQFYSIDAKEFNFVYCGLHESTNSLISEQNLKNRHAKNAKMINDLGRGDKLRSFLQDILSDKLLDLFFHEDIVDIIFDYDAYEREYINMSSGETMVTNLLIDITANVRPNSLLLIDEPEVHLHPNSINQIINVINIFCEEYSSCCLMATHSPMVVQSLLSRNVIIMKRDVDGLPMVDKMRIESLGENLTTINEEVFSNNNTDKYYKKLIERAVDGKTGLNQVLMLLQNADLPMSLSSYMLIDKYLRND